MHVKDHAHVHPLFNKFDSLQEKLSDCMMLTLLSRIQIVRGSGINHVKIV